MRCAIVVGAALILPACTDTNITMPTAGTGGTIVFASDREDEMFQIYRVSGDGKGLQRLTQDPRYHDLSPELSLDGEWIAWEREIATPGGSIESVEIWVMRSDGTEPRVVVQNGSFNESPTWLPDGSAIVYASRVTGNWEIFRLELEGGEPVNLTESPFADQYPRIAPDGSRVLFHSNRDINFEIYVMGPNGEDPRNISQDPAEDRFPAWTPDGRVVWSRFVTSFDLHIMDGDGSNSRALVSTPFEETHAAVSPDGRWVVYQSNRFPPFSLLVSPLAGGEPRTLFGSNIGTHADMGPTWGITAP